MPQHLPPLSDILLKILSVILAGSCAAFAGAMVLRLQSMDNPPADMGLNFPDPPKRHSTDKAVLVDPGSTGSIDRPDMAAPSLGEPIQPYRAETPLRDFRLLTVIDGIAFVEVATLKGREIMPLGIGATLPGAGTVERIDKVGGRWQVVAGSETIVAESRQ
ncbi:MAG: hypothetical protein HY245_07055 [Rhizobiales bacterium]|nr:hypothetical protein [Hyphomicrobiales bacterium]MBI3673161.1 hypothetical protein [Hyphomicrobiales bacterium]